jgi:hypothetical protein
VIKDLPTFEYDPVQMCSICLEQFEKGVKIKLLSCGHQFHAACIDCWLMQQLSCPTCRKDVF